MIVFPFLVFLTVWEAGLTDSAGRGGGGGGGGGSEVFEILGTALPLVATFADAFRF